MSSACAQWLRLKRALHQSNQRILVRKATYSCRGHEVDGILPAFFIQVHVQVVQKV